MSSPSVCASEQVAAYGSNLEQLLLDGIKDVAYSSALEVSWRLFCPEPRAVTCGQSKLRPGYLFWQCLKLQSDCCWALRLESVALTICSSTFMLGLIGLPCSAASATSIASLMNRVLCLI